MYGKDKNTMTSTSHRDNEAHELNKLRPHLKPRSLYTFSPKKIDGVNNMTQSKFSMKPKGMWFACGTDWLDFVSELEKGDALYDKMSKYKYLYEINIDVKKVVKIRSLSGLVKFTKKYGFHGKPYVYKPLTSLIKTSDKRDTHVDRYLYYIDWKRMENDGYCGIIICPSLVLQIHNAERLGNLNLSDSVFWYQGWDVASGVVWNTEALRSTKLMFTKNNKGVWTK